MGDSVGSDREPEWFPVVKHGQVPDCLARVWVRGWRGADDKYPVRIGDMVMPLSSGDDQPPFVVESVNVSASTAHRSVTAAVVGDSPRRADGRTGGIVRGREDTSDGKDHIRVFLEVVDPVESATDTTGSLVIVGNLVLTSVLDADSYGYRAVVGMVEDMCLAEGVGVFLGVRELDLGEDGMSERGRYYRAQDHQVVCLDGGCVPLGWDGWLPGRPQVGDVVAFGFYGFVALAVWDGTTPGDSECCTVLWASDVTTERHQIHDDSRGGPLPRIWSGTGMPSPGQMIVRRWGDFGTPVVVLRQ